MPVPDFSPGEVLTAAAMDSIGLWLVKTQTVGTGVASVTVTDAFSADYDSYRVIIRGIKSSSSTNLLLSFGAVVTGYYGSFYFDSYTGLNTGTARRNNGANLFVGSVEASLGEQITSLDIANPFVSISTSINGTYYGDSVSGFFAGTQASTTSFTSLVLQPSVGTLTGGTIRVYGYRN
jgi:hypothetical protein